MQVSRHRVSGPRASTTLVLLLASLALAGCAGRGGPVGYTPQGLAAPDVEAHPVASQSAPVGALDELTITVFQVEKLSGDFKVDAAGKIDYPLLGSVQAQGRTTEQLRDQLAKGLGEKYLRSPVVSVAVKERAEQTVTVDGAVRKPGMFKVKGPTTLLQAVAMAEGASEDANASRVVVFRTVGGERQAGAFDLVRIRRAQEPDPVIYGNDIVVVDGTRARTLFRDLMGSVPLLSILRPF